MAEEQRYLLEDQLKPGLLRHRLEGVEDAEAVEFITSSPGVLKEEEEERRAIISQGGRAQYGAVIATSLLVMMGLYLTGMNIIVIFHPLYLITY